MYVRMYSMIGKGQIAQKDHIGAKIDLRAKLTVNIYEYNCLLNARCFGTGCSTELFRMQNC